jgi:hypothetical protein
VQDMVWITRDGRSYLVSQMTTSHIINCIRKIQRSQKGWRREYLERLKLELTIRSLGLSV